MTPLVIALVGLGLLLAGWFALGVLIDHLSTRRTAVPARLAVHVLPGWLPSYVREDLADARRDRAQRREGNPRG